MANGEVQEHVEEALLEQTSDDVVMRPASERFWNDHNTLCIVAKFVNGRCCLKAIRLVNLSCSVAFSGKLYHHIRLRINLTFPTRVASIVEHGRLGNTRAITIVTDQKYTSNFLQHGMSFPPSVDKAIIALVRGCPLLRALCVDWPGPQWVRTDLFDSLMVTWGSEGRKPLQCLSLNTALVGPVRSTTVDGLCLKSLCLENLPLLSALSASSWLATVAGILGGSPQLEYLKLSAMTGGSTYTREIDGLLMRICMSYRQSEARPLQLRTLNLGQGMLLRPRFLSIFAITPRYLSFLTRLEFLEEIHMYNVHHQNGLLPPLAYGIISPTATPRLRRVYLDYIDFLCYDHLTMMAFEDPATAAYIAQLDIHVKNPGKFDDSDTERPFPLLPGKPLSAGVDTADLFSSEYVPLRPSGLDLGHIAMGPDTAGGTTLYRRPWGRLRTLRVSIEHRQMVAFAAMCGRYTRDLEVLLVRVVVREAWATRKGVGAAVRRCASNVARGNASLRFVRFECRSEAWDDGDVLFLTWRERCERGPMMFNMDGASVRERCEDDEWEPEELWSEERRMVGLVGEDLW